MSVAQAPFLIVGFGFGASFVALFAQLGGGIYTKAADVGSDLVGKVEAGIPEDDPRNAGVIADLVGDNVGDCAGRGADLFESTAAENIGAMILGVGVFADRVTRPAGRIRRRGSSSRSSCARFGLLATIVAIFFVRGTRDEDPMNMLNRGYWVTTLLSVVGLAFVTYVMMQTTAATGRQRHPGMDLVLPAPASSASPPASPSSTSPSTTRPARSGRSRRSPRRRKTGPATNIIAGTAVGFETTAVTAITIGIALLAQPLPRLSRRSLVDADGNDVGGIFGTAVATMGMLMTTAYILAMDTFGPITDNAGGIAEFSQRRGRRARDHRPPRRGGQHHQGADQGLRHRVGVAGRVPALLAYIDKVNLIQTQPRRDRPC